MTKLNDAVLVPCAGSDNFYIERVVAITKHGTAAVQSVYDQLSVESSKGSWEQVGHFTRIWPFGWRFVPKEGPGDGN